MTHLEIFKEISALIPADLREKYGHLCYGEMAEIPELAPWAADLRWAEDQWTKANDAEGLFS